MLSGRGFVLSANRSYLSPVDGTHARPVAPADLSPRQNDFYQGLRTRIRTWLETVGPGFKYADILLVAPDIFHVLCRLVADKRIPPIQKAKVAATLAYFITPIGVVPEALVGPIGYIDDVALAAYVLNGLLNSEQADIVREHWAGDKDVLSVVRGVLEVADSAIGSGLWRRLKGVRWPIARGPRP
jgi:uncharacterized membrane protein YkvA (DUF1232 family)